MKRGSDTATVSSEAAAAVYLSLDDEDRRQVVDFFGPGKLARFFARLPASTKGAIAATLSPSQANVFQEPFMAIPLAPEERYQLTLFMRLMGRPQRTHV